MNTCPWCGTHTGVLQATCEKCGGRLMKGNGKVDGAEGAGSRLPQLPPGPRPIAGNYAWWLLLTDGWAIAGIVFGILGTTFVLLGAALTLLVARTPLAFCFAPIGFLFVGICTALIAWRWQKAQKIIEVLRSGAAIEGKIVQSRQIKTVRVNRRHPWAVEYQFKVDGQVYSGQVMTFNTPGERYLRGRPVVVLYLPREPQWNSIYPHP